MSSVTTFVGNFVVRFVGNIRLLTLALGTVVALGSGCSAGFQPAVSPISNRQTSQIEERVPRVTERFEHSITLQVGNLRNSRLETCATGEARSSSRVSSKVDGGAAATFEGAQAVESRPTGAPADGRNPPQNDNQGSEGLPESLLALPPEKAGQILAEHARSGRPLERVEFKGKLRIRRGPTERIVPLTFRIEPGKEKWQVVYETGPAEGIKPEKLVVVHKPGEPNEYLYSRPGNEPVSLKPAEAFVPLATSDFALVDLGLDFFHWPQQQVLRGQMRKGRYTYVLDSRLEKPPASAYSKVVSWIDRETGGPLMAEAYDASGKLLKEFLVRRFTKVEGKWQLREMEIRNVQTDSLTRIEFEFED